jgi:hypothetical protein
MRSRLRTWAERVRAGADEREFEEAAEAELAAAADPETAEAYRQAAPFSQSHAGLRRYFEKRRDTASA